MLALYIYILTLLSIHLQYILPVHSTTSYIYSTAYILRACTGLWWLDSSHCVFLCHRVWCPPGSLSCNPVHIFTFQTIELTLTIQSCWHIPTWDNHQGTPEEGIPPIVPGHPGTVHDRATDVTEQALNNWCRSYNLPGCWTGPNSWRLLQHIRWCVSFHGQGTCSHPPRAEKGLFLLPVRGFFGLGRHSLVDCKRRVAREILKSSWHMKILLQLQSQPSMPWWVSEFDQHPM